MRHTITKAMVVLSLAFFAVFAKGQLLPCATPTSLTVLELTPTTARLSWGTGNGDNPFGWYNVRVSTIPLADPRAATGPNIVFSGSVQGGLALPFLTPNTKYYTYVRTDCDTLGNYNGYSAWIRDSITTPCVATTFPITANFDEVAIPDCWRVAGVNKPITNVIHYGSLGRSVRLQSTAIADAYLISAPITELANNLEITFQVYGAVGSKFRVGILTDILNLATIQDIAPLTLIDDNVWAKYTVTTPTSVNAVSGAYVVFYIPAGSAQTVYLDDVDIHVKPACPQPQNLEFSNVSNNSVVLKWDETGSATSWIVRYVTGTGVSKTMPANSNNPFILPGLLSSTEYTVSISSSCGSAYSMPVSFTTPQTPATIPYSTGFETGEDIGWTLVNGNQINKWFIGSASGATYNGSSKALYISNSANGSTYWYDFVSPTSAAAPSFVWAYRTLALQDTTYTVSFNWKANGETSSSGSWDLLRAFLVPDTVKLTAGNPKGMGVGATNNATVNTTPAGWIDVTTNGKDIGILNQKTTWQQISSDIDVAVAGNYNLVFFWKNDNNTNNQPPAAIDNVSVILTACRQPKDILVKNITRTQADISWTPIGRENTWEVMVKKGDNVVWQNFTNTNPTTVSNLSASTDYTVQVRALCSVGDTSAWTTPENFKTACGLTSLPYYEYFDTYNYVTTIGAPSDYPNNPMPPCWLFLNKSQSSTGYPRAFIANMGTYIVSGRCLFVTFSNVTPLYTVLPEFDEPLSNITLLFTYKNMSVGTAQGTLHLGVMTDPADTATFKLLESYEQSATLANIVHDFSKDNLPAGARSIALMFKGGTASNNYMSIDNLSVVKSTTCTQPQSFSFKNISSNGADVVINDSINTAWEASVVPLYAIPSESNVVSLSGSNLKISTLLPETSYYVYLRANCGTAKSTWVGPVTLKTICNGLEPIPYNNNFDKYTQDITTSLALPGAFPNNFLPSCWIFPVTGANSSAYPQAYLSNYSSYSPQSGNYLVLQAAPGNPGFAVLPKFNKPIDSLLLSFNYRSYGTGTSYGNISVGVMTDPMDTTTFKLVKTFAQVTAATPVTNIDFNYSSFPAGVQNIVFKYTGGTSSGNYSGFLDNISVAQSTCPPTHFKVNNITNTSVDVVIDDAANIKWECAIKLSGAPAPTTAGDTTLISRNSTIPKLITSTAYDVYVRAICGGGGTTSWVGPVKFKTMCNPKTTLPYKEPFESYTNTADISTTINAPNNFPNNTLPTCWTFPGLGTSTSTYPQVFLSTYANFQVGSGNYLWLKTTSVTSPAIAALPEFTLPIDSMILSFSYSNYTTGTTAGLLQIGVMTDPMDSTTFVSLQTLPITRTPVTINHDFSYDKNIPAGARVIAFRYIGTYYAFIDNVTLNYTACVRPQSMKIGAVLSNSGEVTVIDDKNGKWNFIIGLKGFNPNNTSAIINTINSTVKTVNFPSLTDNTYYDIYVQSICDVGKSAWRGPLTFKTECLPVDVTYTEGFEHKRNLDCWQIISSGGTAVLNGTYKIEGDSSLAVSNLMAISPRLNVAQLADYQVSGYAYSIKDSARFTIGVMTEPSDITTYAPIKDVLLTAKYQWVDFGLALDTLLKPEMADVAASKYVVFYFPTSTQIYVDYVTIGATPTCLMPSSIYTSNITDTEADVNWTVNGTENKWKVEVLDGASVMWSNVVTDNPAHVTGLKGNTIYTVQVRAICGAADSSVWTLPYQFSTACGILSAPYFEDFERYKGADIVSTTSAPTSYPDHLLPACWTFPNMSESSTGFPQAFLSYNGNYAPVTGNFICLKSSSTISAFAVLPEFNQPLTTLKLSFYYKQDMLGTAYGNLIYGVMSDPNDTTTFVPLRTLSQAYMSTLVEHDFSMDNGLPPGAKYIAFKSKGGSNNGVMFLDNVCVQSLTCQYPTNIKVTQIKTDSAMTSWTARGSATSWEVRVMQGTNVVWSKVVTTNSAVTPGLSSGTNYTVQVRAICGTGSNNIWSVPYRFKTMCAPKTPPYEEKFENYPAIAAIYPSWSATAPDSWYPDNIMPDCWLFPGRSMNVSTFPNTHLSTNSAIAGKSLCFVTVYNATPAYAVLPEFDKPIGTLLLYFDYKAYNSTNAPLGNLQLGVLTDPSDTTTFVSLASLPTATIATNVEHDFSKDNIPADARAIAFRYTNALNTGSTSSDKGNVEILDNISVIVRPSCMIPVNLKVNRITTSQAQVGWTVKNSETKWQIKVMQGTNEVSKDVYYSNPAVVPGLQPGTDYTVQVRSICSVGDTSDWSLPFKFTTMCNPWPVQYDEPFNYTGTDVVTGTTAPSTYPNSLMPTCWIFPVKGTMTPTATYPQAFLTSNSGTAAGTGNYLMLKTDIAARPVFASLPELKVPIDSLLLSFRYRNSNASYGNLYVGVMTDPTDTATFVPVKSFVGIAAATPATAEFNYSSLPANARTIAFKFVSTGTSYTMSLDDIKVTKVSCPTTHFVLKNLTQNSVDIVIDDRANAAWEYAVVTSGSAAPTSGTVITSSTYPVTGLSSGTKYDVYLRGNCGGTWVGPVSIATLCNAITPPYDEKFESYTQDVSTTNSPPATFPKNTMPLCWIIPIKGATTNDYPQAFLSSASGNAAGTGKYFILKATNVLSSYAVLPEFTTPIDSLILSFNYRNYSTGSTYGVLQVGVMKDPIDTTTFTLLKTFPQVTTATPADLSFNFSSLPPGVKNIAFRFAGGSVSSYNFVSIDDISVVHGTCFKPHFTLKNISTNSVDLVIDDKANTQWEYTIVRQGILPSSGSVVPITSTTYNVSPISSSTAYSVYLRANCGTTQGEWDGPVNFTTLQKLVPLPYIYGFEDVVENENWGLVNGTGTSTQTNQWNIGYADNAVKDGDNALYITDDGSTYHYNMSSKSYVYVYRTFNLKDTVYNIAFNWKSNGTSGYDVLRAFIVPANITLTAGVPIDLSDYNNTTPAGWIDATTGNTTAGILQQKSDWQTVNKDINISTAGLYNLVFFWKNTYTYASNTAIYQPPAAVDNIIFRKKNCIKNVNILDTISSSVQYYMDNGFYVSTDTLKTGVNNLSRTELSIVDGVCDMKYNLQLFVVPPVQKVVSDVHCGTTTPYINYGFNIPTPATRTYKRTMYGAGALGADSTIILNLAIQDLQPIIIDKTVCDSKGYFFKGDTIKVSGTYVDSLKSIYGCDSIINLNLTVLPTRDTFAVTICAGKSYLFGGSTYTATGVYEQKGLTNVLGCDSTSVLDLTVLDPIVSDFHETICKGDTLNKYGWTNLTTSGYFTVVKKSVFGCDSTVNLTLVVNPKDTVPDFISVAVDKLPYDYYGFMINNLSEGTYQYFVIVGSNIYHCDSTVNLTVKVTPPSGFDNLYANSIKMYPNPIKVGSEVTIDCNIPESDRQDVVVEVFNVIGEKIYSVRPNVYPIKVKAFDASGIYVVRIRGTKLHYEGKIVVKE